MLEILFRFVVGGAVVSAFAAIAEVLRPKSFAGLFGAAPSVALATLSLTIVSDGARFAATESRSMIFGAVAFFSYASLVSWVLMRRKPKALVTTVAAFPLWFGVALGSWYLFLK